MNDARIKVKEITVQTGGISTGDRENCRPAGHRDNFRQHACPLSEKFGREAVHASGILQDKESHVRHLAEQSLGTNKAPARLIAEIERIPFDVAGKMNYLIWREVQPGAQALKLSQGKRMRFIYDRRLHEPAQLLIAQLLGPNTRKHDFGGALPAGAAHQDVNGTREIESEACLISHHIVWKG